MADDNNFDFVFFKKRGRVHGALRDQGGEQGEEVEARETWAGYVERYVSTAPYDPSHNFGQKMAKLLCDKPLFLSRNIASWRRRNMSVHREEEEEDMDEEEEEETESEEEEEDMEEEEEENALCLNRPKKSTNQMYSEFMKCIKNAKMLIVEGGGMMFSTKTTHVVWGDEMWYKIRALQTARETHSQVSLAKHHKFSRWLDAFHRDKVTTEDDQDCEDWMMGRVEDIQPGTSTCLIEVYDPNKPPYYPFRRYRVRRPTPTPTPSPAPITTRTRTRTRTPSILSSTSPSSISSLPPSAPDPSVTSALDLQPRGRLPPWPSRNC